MGILQRKEHFLNLLGSTPKITDKNEKISAVFEKLNINYVKFISEEYEKAKRSITRRKIPGEDGLMQEVIKYVPIDYIVLDIINKSYTRCEHPNLWNILI